MLYTGWPFKVDFWLLQTVSWSKWKVAKSETRSSWRKRVGTEARNGAVMEGLEADPWHCLPFNIIHDPSLSVSCLSWDFCPARWMERGAKKWKSWITKGYVTHPRSHKKVKECQSGQAAELLWLPAHSFASQMIHCPLPHLRHAFCGSGLSDKT